MTFRLADRNRIVPTCQRCDLRAQRGVRGMGQSSHWFKVDKSEQLCVSAVSLHEAPSEPYAYTKTLLPSTEIQTC